MKTRNVIRDGMTRRARIDPVERLHDAMEFTYRPMLATEVEAVGDAVSRAKPEESIRLTAAAIAGHLESWSEVGEQGKEIPATFENVNLLSFILLNKLYGILAGTVPTAPVSDATPEEEEEYVQGLRQITDGVSPAQAQEQAVGNSETG